MPLHLKARDGDLLLINEPALLTRCAQQSHEINCTALHGTRLQRITAPRPPELIAATQPMLVFILAALRPRTHAYIGHIIFPNWVSTPDMSGATKYNRSHYNQWCCLNWMRHDATWQFEHCLHSACARCLLNVNNADYVDYWCTLQNGGRR